MNLRRVMIAIQSEFFRTYLVLVQPIDWDRDLIATLSVNKEQPSRLDERMTRKGFSADDCRRLRLIMDRIDLNLRLHLRFFIQQ